MNNNLLDESVTLLTNAIRIINVNEEKMSKIGGTFNIFSILDVERREVSGHSAFIFELINPDGSHCQKDAYLRLFVEKALGINDFDYSTVSVYKEKFAGAYGRIDILITSSNYKIVIEVKIDAGDQNRQIERYHQYLEKTKTKRQKQRIYYLTLNGSEPSEISYGELTEKERAAIKTISFQNDILLWLSQCTEKIKIEKVNQAIFQYADILKKITDNFDEDLEGDMKDLILKDIDTFKAALGISSAVKDARQEILDRFIGGVKSKLNNNTFLHDLVENENFDNYYNLPKNRYAHLTYLLKETQYEDINIFLCVELEWRLYFSFWAAKKKSDGSINWDVKIAKKKITAIEEAYFNKLDDILNTDSSDNFFGWDFFKSRKHDLYNFFEADGEYNVEYLADPKILEKETEHLSQSLNEILETVLK